MRRDVHPRPLPVHRTMVGGLLSPATDEEFALTGTGPHSGPVGATAPRAEWRVGKRTE